MSANDLLVKIEILDDDGNVTDERLATTFKKLLEAAHTEKLSAIDTTVLQYPSTTTRETAVVRAVVKTGQGMFSGIGDAAPENVPEKLQSALVRVAETRAICRALRGALCVPYVAVEELADQIRFVSKERTGGDCAAPREDRRPDDQRQRQGVPPKRERGRDDRPTETRTGERDRAMSDSQKRFVFRLCFELGATKENVREHALKALAVARLEYATRLDASRAIDTLKRELGRGGEQRQPAQAGNGAGRGNGANGHGRTGEPTDDIPF